MEDFFTPSQRARHLMGGLVASIVLRLRAQAFRDPDWGRANFELMRDLERLNFQLVTNDAEDSDIAIFRFCAKAADQLWADRHKEEDR